MHSYSGTRLGPILVAALLCAGSLRAQRQEPPRPTIRAVDVKKFAKLAYDLADKAELIDELTEVQSETKVVRPGSVEPEGASLVMTYRISDIELSKSVTNRIWLLGDVPGRTVTTSIRVDCLVHEWYTAPKKIRGGDDRNALLIRLSPARHQVEFAGDAFVLDELGALRLEFLGDGIKAKKLREELYVDAQELALKRFRERVVPESDEVADALKAEVPAAYPDKTVRVDREEFGFRIEIGQFFPTAPDAPPLHVVGSNNSVLHAAAALAVVAIAALVITRVRRRSNP